MNAITLFCGSKSGKNPAFEQMANALGAWLAAEKITLVYGGGNKGLMGATANACLAKGGKVIGIIPKVLLEWEAEHKGLTELIVTENMHVFWNPELYSQQPRFMHKCNIFSRPNSVHTRLDRRSITWHRYCPTHLRLNMQKMGVGFSPPNFSCLPRRRRSHTKPLKLTVLREGKFMNCPN